MHVILTHEQADFDALAALLGAHLVQEKAVPVLPRRMNRNSRAFLNLYGGELPFVDPRDLTGGSIGTITLVDTQSLITVKGINKHTQIQVIDHHNRRPDLPESWTVRIERVGATTTMLVEALQETALTLNSIQATLLLLGIYEDTGSLTYASTTARDVRAAAYLLEQGANLKIAAKHLNPPLSPDQRELYERLLASAEWHHIYGQDIVVACALADDMNEEISSIAHKIRDLLDPDGLVLLVSTHEGVRLIARSTTDRVDVAGLAAHFGGGGHDRASAALIRPGSEVEQFTSQRKADLVEQIHQELISILHQWIRPTTTVGQIMSTRPRLLSPDTSAEEASLLMQRYGYEGFPVVQDNQVLGLLTRRAVDRSLAHRLNLTAGSLMDAGSVTIYPNQPLEHLQRLMVTSGWGQVPVLDPTTDAIIGIVTRTDLLKTLAQGSQLAPGALPNLAEQLSSAMPPARLRFLQQVAAAADDLEVAIYIVGGFVRDLILARPSIDFDIVVEGDAIALARRLAKRHGGQVISHSRFGTAKWDIGAIKSALGGSPAEASDLPDSLDLISARTEFYERPTALPTVERSSIKLDLHRRDFTINTLALRLDGSHYGELHDYWGGLQDLQNGRIRVLHSLSFIDDPTRILRAVRFEQRFGFQIESRTLQLVHEALPLLKQVSGDRIRHELNLILSEERAEQILARLAEQQLLAAIHPALPAALPPQWNQLAPATWELPPSFAGLPSHLALAYLFWLQAVKPAALEEISARLKFSRDLSSAFQRLALLREQLSALPALRPSQVVQRLGDVPQTVVWVLYATAGDSAIREQLERFALQWRHVHPAIDGNRLREMGLPPGPLYKTVLQGLRDAWLDGQIHTPEEEAGLLQRLLAEQPDGQTRSIFPN